MSEVWVAVPGYLGRYEVSDQGNFRRTTLGKGARDYVVRCGKRRSYLNVVLCENGVRKTYSAHRLIWQAFNGPIPNGMQINHRNGVKSDNRLENLEVCTPSENTRHALYELGHVNVPPPHVPGVKNGRALVTEADVVAIRSLYASKRMTQTEIATVFGLKQSTVSQIVLRKCWKHVA